MDLENLNASDLTDANLGTLLSEIDNALTNNEYTKVKKAIEQINTFLCTPAIINVGRDAKSTIDIGTETVDIGKIATAITNKMQADLNSKTTPNADRDEVINEMDKYLFAIFNQEKLMGELVQRGFSIADFEKAIDQANKISRDHIDLLKAQEKEQAREYEALIGKDVLIHAGNYASKSYATIIRQCQEANAALEVARRKFDDLDKLKVARTAETDPAKQTKLDEQIKRAENSLKYLANNIKDMNIKGIDETVFENWEQKSKADAETVINAQLANIMPEIDASYRELNSRVAALSQAEKNKLGIDANLADAFAKVNDPDQTIKQQARADVDKYLAKTKGSQNVQIAVQIKREERLIELRKKNVEKYKEIYTKTNDISSKVKLMTESKPIEVPKMKGTYKQVDIDGTKYWYFEAEYETESDGTTLKKDASGNPIPVYEYKTESGVQKPVMERQKVQAIDLNNNQPMTKQILVNGENIEVPLYENYTNRDGKEFPKIYTVQKIISRDKIERDANGKYVKDPTTGSYKLVQKIDQNGHPVTDTNGNPVYEQEPEFDIMNMNQKDKDYYLQKGFNESQALQNIDQTYNTRKKKRIFMRDNRIGNPFTRLFATKRLWNQARKELLEGIKNGFIERQVRNEYDVVIDGESKINAFQKLFDRIKNSAAIQHQLYNAGKDQGKDAANVDKTVVIDDLLDAVYEETLYRTAEEGKDEMKDIRKESTKVGENAHENLVKKHAEKHQKQYDDAMHVAIDDSDLEL